MSKKFLHAFLAITAAACLLTSCRSDLNLSEVDTSMEAHLKMALPVASVSMQFGNLLHLDQTTTLSFDTIGETPVLCFQLTTDPDTTRKFSVFDLNGKLKGAEFGVNVYDQLKDKSYHVSIPLPGGGSIDTVIPFILAAELLEGFDTLYLPKEVPGFDSTMVFSLALPLSEINREGLAQRVDSVKFDIAQFGIVLNKDSFEGISMDWIQEITLELGDEFDMHGKPNKQIIYSPSLGIAWDFGQQKDIPLEDWALKLLTKATDHPTMADVTDTIHVKASIKYSVPQGVKIAINKHSGLKCNINVGELKPTYLWGWFTPYKDMFDEGKFPLNIDFKDLPFLSDESTVLPFSRPELEARLRTQVAGVVRLDSSYVFAKDAKGVKHSAMFEDPTTHELSSIFNYKFPKSECIDPSTMSSTNDTTNLHLQFDKDFGHIQNLFEGGIPKEVTYKFRFSFDEEQTPQIRIPMNTFVHLYTRAKLPFTFQDGFYLKYSNNAENIDISQFDIDSILYKAFEERAQLGDSSKVGVVMKTESTVPLHIKLVLRCYNDSDQVIMDPENPSQEFKIFDKDTLDIYPPDVEQSSTLDSWTITPNDTTYNTATLTKKQLRVFPRTKALRYTLIIDESCMQETWKKGVYDVPIGADGTIKFTIGVTADIDAAIQLNLNSK